MNIYQLVKDTYVEVRGSTPETADVERLVGTLRVAGVSSSSEKDVKLAKKIVKNNLRTTAVHTAGVQTSKQMELGSMEPVTQATQFKDIEALVKKKQCPRCKTKMVNVKLNDYRTALYCESDKVTLWAN